jgi:hypothetical protein
VPSGTRIHIGPAAHGDETAAFRAATLVAAVRDDPLARLRLMSQTYYGPTGRAPRHLPFRRAALAFMRWEVTRGLLNPLDAVPPGSPWWRALNERLLRDGCEAVARASGLGGDPSTGSMIQWMAFVDEPTPSNWYRAHNASIVGGYVNERLLADQESLVERFFMNVVLIRVLYAHALVASSKFALGRLSRLGPLLGDPRLGMAGIFLSLGRVLPDRYPPAGNVDSYLRAERGFGRMLDWAVIAPRLEELYEWSAGELQQPALTGFLRNGRPSYAWPETENHVWDAPPLSRSARLLRLITGPGF